MDEPIMNSPSIKPEVDGEVVLGVLRFSGLPVLISWSDADEIWENNDVDDDYFESDELRGWYSLKCFKEVNKPLKR